jgi:two-component sensor histidine kinase
MAATVAFGGAAGLYGVVLSTFLSLYLFPPGNSIVVDRAGDLIEVEIFGLLAGAGVAGLASLCRALIAASEAAQTLARSEETKSVLLRELAHRVANNFAAVASLIRRKASLVDNGEARSVLNEAVEQVMVLSRVHSRLHPGSNDLSLDSKSFLEELCDDLKVLIPPDQALSIECLAASCRLSVAQAIPLGLIVNELVTNAIKYAFPDGRSGTIYVGLQRAGDRISLSVQDDGVGFNGSNGSSAGRGTGVGHDLVRALAQQLGGDLQIRSAAGTGSKLRVVFPSVTSAPAAPARPGAELLH